MLAVAYATRRASHARQVKGDDPDNKGYPSPPVWGWARGEPHPVKQLRRQNLKLQSVHPRCVV
jgi:hypothetical protein